jgi:hypothetical protein
MRLRPFSVASICFFASFSIVSAAPVAINNAGFETNVLSNPSPSGPDNFIGAAGQGTTPTAVPGWTFTAGSNPDSFTAYGGVSDLAVPNHATEGLLDNNIAWLFIRPTGVFGSMSVSQQLAGISLENNTRYTLSIRVAQARREEGIESKPNPVFPALGDGVSTGNVFARLMVSGLATAMPGFLPALSVVSAPADNEWVTWTLNWQTGASESLAGQALSVQLLHQGTQAVGGLPAEVFFDDVAVTATAVPEPTTFVNLVFGMSLLWSQRRRRSKNSSPPTYAQQRAE